MVFQISDKQALNKLAPQFETEDVTFITLTLFSWGIKDIWEDWREKYRMIPHVTELYTDVEYVNFKRNTIEPYLRSIKKWTLLYDK